MTLLNSMQVIFLWSLMVLVLLAVGHVKCSITECPRYCKCDVYRQLNRAECSSRHLISAEVEIPHVVQILDLSFNDITTIETKTFQNYKHLVLLNLSHNAIYTLELAAFTHLRSIHEIDLSHNRLQYVDDRTFESNRKLRKLNLEGNKFITIVAKPFLKSSSLKQLNLRDSQITFIHKSLFSQLENIEELDLSANLLNNFLPQDFDELLKLRILNLSQNPMRCDISMKQKLQQLENKGIQVSMEQCQTSQNLLLVGEEKFQKMRAMPAQNRHPDDQEFPLQWHYDFPREIPDDDFDVNYENPLGAQQDLLTTNEWLKFTSDAVPCTSSKENLCQNYRQCLENLENAWHEHRSSHSFSSSEAKFGFFLGVACGLSTAIIFLTCALCMKNCYKNKRRERHLDVELTMNTEPHEVSPPPMARSRQQLPPPARRQPRRRAPVPQRPMVRYEGPVAENFLTRLFGIPARHQYYRTINQNTATLIRRLSRSNLFNNRLSRQFSNERTAGSEAENDSPTAPRPETPPPCYGDIIGDASGERK